MARYIENSSLPIQPFSGAQASILDFLFPGFTRMSAAVQWYLTIDLNVYVPLLCFFGLIVFGCGRICKYFRKSPEQAIDNVEQLISKPIGAKSKPPRISEDAKPEDAQLV
jgi:hypothetical protein